MDDDLIELQQLRRRVPMLEDQARRNEHIWSGFHSIEIDMVGAQSFGELLNILSDGILQTFHNVECVTIACFDPEYELTRLLQNVDADGGLNKLFVAIGSGTTANLFRQPYHPWLGPFDSSKHGSLFPGIHEVGSVALAPLVFKGQLMGSLNQGSRKAGHFISHDATDLLEHLAAVTAMCIDSAVSHERLKLDGLTDPLTGISNRRFFERRLKEEVERWRRSGFSLCCVVVDIDHFKRVNDQFGHQTGDVVLQRVALELGKVLRSSDVLARYGGEEFVLLLPETSMSVAVEIAERLRKDISGIEFDNKMPADFQVTVSLGLANLTRDNDAEDDPGSWLFDQADKALYLAKEGGRNRVVVAATRSVQASEG